MDTTWEARKDTTRATNPLRQVMDSVYQRFCGVCLDTREIYMRRNNLRFDHRRQRHDLMSNSWQTSIVTHHSLLKYAFWWQKRRVFRWDNPDEVVGNESVQKVFKASLHRWCGRKSEASKVTTNRISHERLQEKQTVSLCRRFKTTATGNPCRTWIHLDFGRRCCIGRGNDLLMKIRWETRG